MNEFKKPTRDELRAQHEFEERGRVAGRVAVGLDFRTTWCVRHLAPFRERWPRGAARAMTMLFQAFCADERTQAMTGADASKLAAVTAECSPLCCFLGDDALAPIYAVAGVSPPPGGGA